MAEKQETTRKGVEISVSVQHCYTPARFLHLRNKLVDVINMHVPDMPPMVVTGIAEGLFGEDLINLPELNRITPPSEATAAIAGGFQPHPPCTNASCDGPKRGHAHGNLCGPLCSCGEGE